MTTAAAPMPHRLALYLQLIRWDRPAGWLLLLWPTLSALWLAAGGFPGWRLVAVFTLGTVLMRSAGCCINDVADREFDRHVQRTAQRPVTAGQIAPREALAVGAVLALAAFGLVLTTNAATIALSVPALAVAMAYPYAKRFVAMPQAVLGVAFSFGIPMAFAAVLAEPAVAPAGLEVLRDAVGAAETVSWTEVVPPLAWGLVVGNLFWVLAYDTEYAMVDREDDLKIGIRTSAITLGRLDAAAVMGCYGIFLGIWGLLGMANGLGRAFALGLAAAAAQALWHWTLIRSRSREGCFKAFRLNHWVGFALFAGIVVDLARR